MQSACGRMDDAKPKTWSEDLTEDAGLGEDLERKTWNCLIRCSGRGAAHPPRVCYAASHPKLHCIAQNATI